MGGGFLLANRKLRQDLRLSHTNFLCGATVPLHGTYDNKIFGYRIELTCAF